MPPMDALGGDMGGNPPLDMPDGQMPMDNQPQGDDGMGFDDNQGFDAGVDANAEEDPKKYLQQLTGKLSQELRKYNDEQEQPDEDLNKYIAGMIIPQAAKGMTDKGKNEVIKKIKSGQVDKPTEDDDIQTESINEIINNTLEDDKYYEKRKENKICNKTLPKHSPFRSNR